MTDSNVGREIQDEVLSAIRKSQAAVVDAIERWTTTVQSLKPELPDLNLPFADNIADKLPKPEELVKSAYDFAEKLLASQRKFAEDVLKATTPLLTSGHGADEKKKKKSD
jgi:transketolase